MSCFKLLICKTSICNGSKKSCKDFSTLNFEAIADTSILGCRGFYLLFSYVLLRRLYFFLFWPKRKKIILISQTQKELFDQQITQWSTLILEGLFDWKLKLSKMSKTKKVFLKEKKKIWIIFDDRKLTLKVRCLHFLTTHHYVSSQNIIISFWNIDV